MSKSLGWRIAAIRGLAVPTALLVLLAGLPAFATPTLTTLATFDGSTGTAPYGSLAIDAAGNLYGATFWGATVFEVAKGSGQVTSLANLSPVGMGNPSAGLMRDTAGNLYGTASFGGPSTYGTVFMVAATTHTVTTLASFNGPNGGLPECSLVADSAGNLYGTTYRGPFDPTSGQTSGVGTVFEVAKGSGQATTLATFNGSNGGLSQAGVILDAAGNLYGTTTWGGANSSGTVFEVAKGSGTVTTIATFNGANGAIPEAGLTMDTAGNMYGTTSTGGANNDGTVFKIDATTHQLTTLVNFSGTNGLVPYAGLIIDANGNLYGTTEDGGTHNDGIVFKFNVSTGVLTTLATFNNTNGEDPDPFGSLIADASGNLYGVTASGGASNDGTVFEISNSGFVAPAPEPASLALLALGGLTLMPHRRSRRA